MPYHYTHYRFGKDLLEKLPLPERQCIARFRRMYDMGLQGPDIFYYHNPFWGTSQGALGDFFHQQTGQAFFPAAFAAAKNEAARAYLLGLVAHYCLDSLCHPYIDTLVAIGEVRHIALESEWDRYLLQADGVPAPHTYDMSRRLRLTRGECISVSAFYPGSTPGGVRSSIQFMAFAARFFARGSREAKRRLLSRIQPAFCDFFLPTEASAELSLYIAELEDRYRQALETCPRLLEELLQQQGETLSEAFAPIFG